MTWDPPSYALVPLDELTEDHARIGRSPIRSLSVANDDGADFALVKLRGTPPALFADCRIVSHQQAVALLSAGVAADGIDPDAAARRARLYARADDVGAM